MPMQELVRRLLRRIFAIIVVIMIGVFAYIILFPVHSDTLKAYRSKMVSFKFTNTYFMNSDQPHSKNGKNPNQVCVHPQLELWHPSIKKYFKDMPPLQCSPEENWVFAQNGTFQISPTALKKHGDISCKYVPKIRASDFKVIDGSPELPMKSGALLKSDFFEAVCSAPDGKSYSNLHSGIMFNQKIHEDAGKKELPKEALGLNILIFGLDSTSRMTWMRNLPKTQDYFVNTLKGIVLEGYNIVGDGTPQALLPILTGKTEPELPEARRGHLNSKQVDGHPWIWKDLKKQGYVTQWGEDGASAGTFTYRMLGFKDPPVDHYMRPFYIMAESQYWRHKPFCLGSVPRHLNMLNWIRDFYDMYKNKRKFSFLFHSEYTHGGYSEARMADSDIRDFLQDMEKKNYLNDTVLILMADHGARYQNIRQTPQGKFEERMPYFSFRFPPWFEKKYPEAIKNLKTNVHRLTTPFDIHATFHHLMNFTDFGKGDIRERGISLLKEIPLERSCKEAAIESHWCACLQWDDVSVHDINVQNAAKALVDAINKITESQIKNCVRLSIDNITSAVQYTPNEKLLKFKQSRDSDGRLPDLSDDMKVSDALYQIQVRTRPGKGFFEATIKHIMVDNTFLVNEKEISRINKYGSQPYCIMNDFPHLRPYCYCKVQME